MTEQLTPKEYLTLQHLADGKDHGKSPDSLTDAQYYSALKSLKDKDMVYAAFVEGGEVYAAQIKTNGKAILDDLSDEANYIIRKLIKKENITDNQFLLLKVARDNNGAKNVFGITNDVYKKQIWSPLIGRGYLKLERAINSIVITPLGNRFLTQIDKDLAYEITSNDKTNNVSSSEYANTTTMPKENIVSRPCIKINEEHRKQIIEDIITANHFGHFKDQNGNPFNDKQIIYAFAQFFDDEKMKDFATSKEEINSANVELVKKMCPLFYNNIVVTNSFIEKIKSTNTNTETTRIAAEFVNKKLLSDLSCKKPLWEILHNNNLYSAKLNNWCKSINTFLK